MPWIPGEHWIYCGSCNKKIFRSECTQSRHGTLECRDCVDYRIPGIDTPMFKGPHDPIPLDARRLQIGDDGIESFRATNYWQEIETTWNTLNTKWTDLGPQDE